MNVLVTGGAGYIGRHLVNALLAEGHMVRVLDLQAPDAPQSPGGCEFVQGSLADSSLVAKVVQGIQAVHHLAWSFQPGDERREIEERSTVRPGPNLSTKSTFLIRSKAPLEGRATGSPSWPARSTARATSGEACR
jgi:uncharacterized protein YbjT (DUF2867 family)